MTKSPPKKMLKKNDKEERKKRSAALSVSSIFSYFFKLSWQIVSWSQPPLLPATLSSPYLEHHLLRPYWIPFFWKWGVPSFNLLQLNSLQKEDGFCTFFSEYETKDNVSVRVKNWVMPLVVCSYRSLQLMPWKSWSVIILFTELFFFCLKLNCKPKQE